jgi:NADH:ubiquinone oxidoreductase subunit 5 (subunit L)/multisubunit Na+/H+ antiporter MnhA subunit
MTVLLWSGVLALPALAFGATWASPDGLSTAIATLTLLVGAVVASFSLRYMRADPLRDTYWLMIALLLASVLTFTLTSNIAAFALAWIASGLLLARLIGHASGRSDARQAARRTLVTFALGDAALLIGLGLLVAIPGSWDVGVVLARAPAMPSVPLVSAAALLLIGAAARCALPPFSGWLLSSMTAPTPVSALMHAGLVNAGGLLLLRFAPVLEAAPAVRLAAVGMGFVAALYGIGVMVVRPDIKRSLAGSTVSQMGFMIMSFGLGAYAAALWHIVAHGLFKAWLFLGSGSGIGMRAAGPGTLCGPVAIRTIAGLTLLGGTALIGTGQAGAGLIPLLLGTATAAAMIVSSLKSPLSIAGRLRLVAMIGVLIGFHAAGLMLAHAAIKSDAGAILPPWASIAILGCFLLLWSGQVGKLAARSSLPAPVYVRLLNAGALKTTLSGDVK